MELTFNKEGNRWVCEFPSQCGTLHVEMKEKKSFVVYVGVDGMERRPIFAMADNQKKACIVKFHLDDGMIVRCEAKSEVVRAVLLDNTSCCGGGSGSGSLDPEDFIEPIPDDTISTLFPDGEGGVVVPEEPDEDVEHDPEDDIEPIPDETIETLFP